ncbi:MAG: aminotransferase class V-fold PLP-dependent enzyme [Ignavibacteria bacterium]|nr:aminotransferase class V-fold PLP-dependent enzyme [Ignavibacteria bacterium]MBI3766814.1 aminotransferase class V-fold PLP-dependent enzyme [Ignavibacteriales bacterium]
MLEKIKQLETASRLLEPSPEQRASLRDPVIRYSENFLNRIYEIPAYVTTEDKGKGIFDSPISDEPLDINAVIRLVEYNIDRPGLNPASGGHLGYIPGGGIYFSALGDYLADVTNRFAGIFYGGPGAVRMEQMLLEWMMSVVGYPRTSGGNLTSGGSIANLIGIVAARDAYNLKAKDVERSAIYLTSQAHHSVDKAIRIAGLKECILRYVPVDERYRMDAKALEQMIHSDKSAGLHPWLVIASAGTTDVGAVDPIATIGDIARTHRLWFHLDAAYGGFFVLCEEGKKILKGMEKSDSLVMDPHKGLFLPYGTGAAIIKERKKLSDAFWYQASYLEDAAKSSDEISPADVSPELTKHFRGMRLWLPLKLVGVQPFRAALEEKLLLTRYAYGQIKQTPGFEVGPFPDLSVMTFRYIPRRGDANVFNQRLIEEVVRDGKVFLSSTRLDGKFVLRIAVLCFRTHLNTIEYAIDILKRKAKQLEETM